MLLGSSSLQEVTKQGTANNARSRSVRFIMFFWGGIRCFFGLY